MNIALIGFGKVSYNLVKLIQSPGINFITSSQERSKDTVELIKRADVEVYETFDQAIEFADVIISANSPSQSVEVARKYGNCNAVYLDLNNISPKTANEINLLVNNFVDGAIIGKIDSDKPTLYLSGVNAGKLLFLDEFLNVKIISDRIGDASNLKLLRSTFTKSLSVLLIESYNLAQSLGLEDEFFEALSLTEGDDFKQKSLSRINNTIKSSKRKSEELEEILNYFDTDDLKMVKTAMNSLKQF